MPDHLTMLRGERIELGPIRRDLLETYVRWFNDLEVTRTLAVPNIPMTLESEENWFSGASLDTSSAMFTIFLRESGQAIGNVGLHDIDNLHSTANFGIVIGERSVWNQGYGTETTILMLQYGFDVLGLSNIMLEVYGTNPSGIRAYEKAGFRHIGIRRSAFKAGRDRADVYFMDAIPDDVPPSDLRTLLHDGTPQT